MSLLNVIGKHLFYIFGIFSIPLPSLLLDFLLKPNDVFVILFLLLFTSRGGNPARNQRKGNTRPPPNFTRLINCPFAASAHFHKKLNHWKFNVTNPRHNHESSLDPAAHTANRKLTDTLYEDMKRLGEAGLKPSAILEALKKTHPEESILATISTIYTARKKAQQEMLQGISPIVHLNRTLADSDFTTHTKVDHDGELKALFFCHSCSIKLLSKYHYLLLLDCTYKTNKYKMPLLHITGITGSSKTFSVAFCFLSHETQDYYNWALQCLLTVFESNNIPIPTVFVTDREQALINSLSTTFPTSSHMLCTWHIQKNLLTNAAKTIKDKSRKKEMLKHWNNLIQLPLESEFRSSFERFASEYGPAFQEYVTTTWLPVADKYSNAWTKMLPHFGHRTTSRIESAHSFIKTHLLGPQYSFSSVIKMITIALEAQSHEISAQFHQQKINSLKNLPRIFENCLGKVTHYALRQAQRNFSEVSNVQRNDVCNGFHRIRTGIPCKHQLAELGWQGQMLEPSEFHPQWRINVSFSSFLIFFMFFFFCGVWAGSHRSNYLNIGT